MIRQIFKYLNQISSQQSSYILTPYPKETITAFKDNLFYSFGHEEIEDAYKN